MSKIYVKGKSGRDYEFEVEDRLLVENTFEFMGRMTVVLPPWILRESGLPGASADTPYYAWLMKEETS